MTRATTEIGLLDPTESGIVHMLEYDVNRRLNAEEDFAFQNLVVRRVPDGICLEGSLVTDATDVEARIWRIVREVVDGGVVHNHLFVRRAAVPPKG